MSVFLNFSQFRTYIWLYLQQFVAFDYSWDNWRRASLGNSEVVGTKEKSIWIKSNCCCFYGHFSLLVSVYELSLLYRCRPPTVATVGKQLQSFIFLFNVFNYFTFYLYKKWQNHPCITNTHFVLFHHSSNADIYKPGGIKCGSEERRVKGKDGNSARMSSNNYQLKKWQRKKLVFHHVVLITTVVSGFCVSRLVDAIYI